MERVFLGWNSHFLNLVTNYLIKNYKKNNFLDLKNVSLVVSGAKIFKRLLEILLLDSEKQGYSLIPPKIYTPYDFFSHVVNFCNNEEFDNDRKIVSDLESTLVFAKAIKINATIVSNSILTNTNFQNDESSLILLADKIYSLYKDISSVNLLFDEIPTKASILEDFSEDNRWNVLNQIYITYKEILNANNLTDIFIERKKFIQNYKDNSVILDSEVLFLNIPDLNKVFCEISKKIKSPIKHLIFASKDYSNYFDEYGNVKVSEWIKSDLNISNKNLLFADNPQELGKIISNLIAKYSKEYSSNDMVIGVTDDSLIPSIKFECENKNIKVVSVRDNDISCTNIHEVIDAIKTYMSSPTYQNFVNLIQKNDILNYIIKNNNSLTINDILISLDKYNDNHLPYYFKKFPTNFLSNSSSESDNVVYNIFNLIQDLIPGFDCKKTIDNWSEDILNLFFKLYDNIEISKTSNEDKVLFTTYNAYKDAIISLSNVAKYFDFEISFSNVLMLLNILVKNTIFGIVLNGNEVEIQGWLEISNDDSNFLILAGLSEGNWPQSINQDEFLPNSLRKVLGLIDNDFRYARDLFMTKAILNSKEQVFFVPLKYNLNSDSINLLSKILLATDYKNQARRLINFYSQTSENNVLNSNNHDDKLEFFVDPKLSNFDINTIPVSAFKVYKNNPYEYYLNYVLKLDDIELNQEEISNIVYGNIYHDILDSFGKSKIKNSNDSNEIFNFLLNTLNKYVYDNFYKDYLPTINIQLESIKSILKYYASWQANWAYEGWEIIKTESNLDNFYLEVEGEKVKITGRIDRMDYNKKLNQWFIMDYKTGMKGVDMSNIYRTRLKTWVDYQMPLYVVYFNKFKKLDNIHFAYVNLYQVDNPKYFQEILIDDEMLDIATNEAIDIIKLIKSGEFWPLSQTALKRLNAFS